MDVYDHVIMLFSADRVSPSGKITLSEFKTVPRTVDQLLELNDRLNRDVYPKLQRHHVTIALKRLVDSGTVRRDGKVFYCRGFSSRDEVDEPSCYFCGRYAKDGRELKRHQLNTMGYVRREWVHEDCLARHNVFKRTG